MKSKTTIAIQRSRAVDKRHNANCEMSSFKETTEHQSTGGGGFGVGRVTFLGAIQFLLLHVPSCFTLQHQRIISQSNIILVGPKFGKLLGFSIFGFTYVVYRK